MCMKSLNNLCEIMNRRNFIKHGTSGVLTGVAFGLHLACADQEAENMTAADLKTPLCDLLGITYPIVQAGMGDVAGPELVAAVSNAGGFGILTATMMPPEVVRERIQKVKELTDKPFGVNLLLQKDLFPPADFTISDTTVKAVHSILNDFRRQLDIPESNAKPPKLPPLIQAAFQIILEESIPVFSVGLGNPSKEMVAQCHDRGIKVMAMVTTLEDALAVQANGVDIIVAQGSEAGGHRSTWEKKPSPEWSAIGTLPLTSALVHATSKPILAAGGIVNGRGLRAMLALGAQGVLMGTRFVATKESIAPDSYKQALIAGSSDRTIITDVFTGMYARVLRNTFTETYLETDTPVLPPGRQYAATIDIVKAAGQKERPELYTLYAGQGIDEVNEIKSVKEVIDAIVAEAIE